MPLHNTEVPLFSINGRKLSLLSGITLIGKQRLHNTTVPCHRPQASLQEYISTRYPAFFRFAACEHCTYLLTLNDPWLTMIAVDIK